ncbi:uncharacterized protein LOC116940453 isoform X2 [Petromyzon marinus]|uniref:uncharacterized protein LOC116940453 isoform X2 n=1 Tax=Petromyzon marinus TaxID=7757 RepID=UPI003F7252CA
MATDERFKKKTEQLRILLDDLKKLSRFDSSTVPTMQRIDVIRDPYNMEEWQALVRAFHKEGGVELYMKMLTSLSPDASNVPDNLQRPMEWSTLNVLNYVALFPDPKTTFVDCGGLKFLLSLLKHHACQGLMLRFESRNTLRFAVSTLSNLSMEPELKSCFHQELAADVLACYLDVPDAPCKLSALRALARVSTEQDLDIICNAQGAISLLTDMVNRPSYKDYTALENILYPATGLVETLTMVSITAGIRRKTLQPGAELDEEALQELLPELRAKLKVETEKRDYTLEWGDIAVHPTRRSVQKWPKAGDGLIYVPYKVSVAFYDGDVKKIEEAALEFEKKTCVRFIPRSNEADYIYIHAWEGNWSFLGHQGGDQALSLVPGKVTKGTVLHELMHALGFHHEHCRSDRDDHVWVLSDNIKEDWKDAIEKKTSHGHNLTTPYDYSSITHYSMIAGSKDEQSPTMIPKNMRRMRRFGGCHTLSDGDVMKIEKMFDCEPATSGPSDAAEAWPSSDTGASRMHKDAGTTLDRSTIESLVGVWDKSNVEENEDSFKDPPVRCGGVKDGLSSQTVCHWPQHDDGNVYIPVKVSADFYDYDVEAINSAKQEFEKKTCIRFCPHGNEEDFIHIQALEGFPSRNWSFLGRQGGDQALSLEPGKVTKGVVLHELMHALGFHHEHCRSDRDDHVWVVSENVKDEWKGDVVKIKSTPHDLVTPYDCSSIMHYTMTAGSVDERNPTIIPKNPLLMLHMGHGNSLSSCDATKVQKLYGYEPLKQEIPQEGTNNLACEHAQKSEEAQDNVEHGVGAWKKKTKEEIEQEAEIKGIEWKRVTGPLMSVLTDLMELSCFDRSAVPLLQSLLDILQLERPEKDKEVLFEAYMENGGSVLMKKMMESLKPDGARMHILSLTQNICMAHSKYNISTGGKAFEKNGDIVGDDSEEIVKWPLHEDGNVYIPYNISTAFASEDKLTIDQAISELKQKTCVHLIERKEEPDYINFQALEGSWSFLGKKGGAQSVSLEPGKVEKGTVLHELMHALGFQHEHCRSDRDQYIKVQEDNIKEDELSQFKCRDSSDHDLGLPYDYVSIMHYERWSSSADHFSPTIIPIPNERTPIGQRGCLSPFDVLKIKRMYKSISEDTSAEDEQELEKAGVETKELISRITVDSSTEIAARLKECQETLKEVADDSDCGETLRKDMQMASNMLKIFENMPPEIVGSTISMASNLMRGSTNGEKEKLSELCGQALTFMGNAPEEMSANVMRSMETVSADMLPVILRSLKDMSPEMVGSLLRTSSFMSASNDVSRPTESMSPDRLADVYKLYSQMPPELLKSILTMQSNNLQVSGNPGSELTANITRSMATMSPDMLSNLFGLCAQMPPEMLRTLTMQSNMIQGNAQLNPPADPRPQNDDSIDLGPLPPGWEENVHTDGRTYYTNHNTQKTQWEDPRLQNCGATGPMLASLMNMGLKLMQVNPQLEAPVPLSSEKKVKPNDLGPLPPGWEESVRADGRSYFIDHKNKKTQWEDPRLQNLAAAGPITEESEDQEKKTEESQTQEHDASEISDNPGEECKQK